MAENATDGRWRLLRARGVADETQAFGLPNDVLTRQVVAIKLCLGHSRRGKIQCSSGGTARRQHTRSG
ncbi:MAG TPA: hypothetical protein VNN62_03300 [Methylomirabilota bacterium]|nr:hypothetical protein [Methylomirabilota bacterium]